MGSPPPSDLMATRSSSVNSSLVSDLAQWAPIECDLRLSRWGGLPTVDVEADDDDDEVAVA